MKEEFEMYDPFMMEGELDPDTGLPVEEEEDDDEDEEEKKDAAADEEPLI